MRLAMEMNKASHPVLYLEVSGLGLASSVEVGRFVSPRIQRRARVSRWKQEPDGRRDKGRGGAGAECPGQARPCSDRVVAAVVAVDGGSSVGVSQ